MGKFKQGILGPFSGKVGAVVGAQWRGISYMRGVPRVQSKPRTDLQNAQSSKLTLFRGFLLGVGDIVNKCFQNFDQYTEMNGALSYNMKYAVAGSYPDFEVDFPSFVFAKGELLGSWTPTACSKSIGKLRVSWKNRPFSNLSSSDDNVQVILYCVKTEQFHIYDHIGIRSDKSVKLDVREDVRGNTVHCYLHFYSDKFKISSTNEYIGEILVK